MFSLLRTGPARLTPEQDHQRTGDGTAVLLDVREAPEWKASHAPGALHLPLSRLLAGDPLPETLQGKPIVAICRSGHLSQAAAKLLARRGIEATDVVGGMAAWARAGLPLSGGRGDGVIA